LPRVETSQLQQRIVERHQIHIFCVWRRQRLVERQLMSAATLCRAVPARVLDQNLPHQLRRNGEEMLAVRKSSRGPLAQPEISLMDQRRALQGVVAALFPEVPVRLTAQFVVDPGNQALERAFLSI